jgi:hypothetical protein
MNIKINLPSLKDQEKIVEKNKVDLKPNKLRTSFEFSEEINTFLDHESENLGIPPSELFRRIIEETVVDMAPFKRKLKNLTIYQNHMEKLSLLADEIIPDAWKGKRGGNKSQVAEILVREYIKKSIAKQSGK